LAKNHSFEGYALAFGAVRWPRRNGERASSASRRKERDDEAARDTTRGGHAGRAGYNRLIGSNQRDWISGGGGDDLIKGQRSIDSLNGGAGNDDIYAGPRDERARDTVVGGRGKDFVQVFNRPAAKDVVNCGKDRDRVVADSEDVLSDCERKRSR
jgi:Ca2+-binding RTX toxin-like protein